MEEANYKEDHFPMDLKLAYYTLLNVLGIVTGLYGYFVRPWEKVRLLVGLGATLYLLLSALWMLLSAYFLTSTTFRGSNNNIINNNAAVTKDNKKNVVWVRSECFLPEGVYRVKRIDPVTGKEGEVLGEGHVQLWVNDKGRILAEKICRELFASIASKLSFTKSD